MSIYNKVHDGLSTSRVDVHSAATSIQPSFSTSFHYCPFSEDVVILTLAVGLVLAMARL